MMNAIKAAVVALVIYGLASSGLLAVWCDESGCGVQVYSIGGYYVQGAGL
jgi:hypothetical protein|tara:strand:+ start:108 stop:257 length:150 start_codon:yes stop_codon:yes gene_type:complete